MPPRRQFLLWPIASVFILTVTGVLSRDPLVDALTGEPAEAVGLTFSLGYLVSAPIGGLLDALSLLTDRQHVAVLLSVIALIGGWCVARSISSIVNRGRIFRELLIAAAAVAAFVAFYGYGVLGVRPMASLRSYDPELAIVDFHSHTEASHDGRAGLDIRTRREWHRGAGFDLVYVTDHSHVETALKAGAGNPARAGDGTSLLPGREVVFRDQHVLVLGTHDPTAGISDDSPWPILIQTIPNNLSRVPGPTHADRGGVQAIELLDADPRGLRQSVEDRDLILSIADSLNLALIAGSNHHGWGRTAAAWTLIRIPGWQSQRPEEVGRQVEVRIRRDRADALQVVERRRLKGGTSTESALMAATTLPRLGWHVLTSLTLRERLAWIAWVLLATFLKARLASRETRTTSYSP